MDNPRKRKATSQHKSSPARKKYKKQQANQNQSKKKSFGFCTAVVAGDRGFFVTCHLNHEGFAKQQAKILFDQYAKKLYPSEVEAEDAQGEDGIDDIEAEIHSEVSALKDPSAEHLFESRLLMVPCVVYFKTRHPVDPVFLVREICEAKRVDGRFPGSSAVQRITPITEFGHASVKGLVDLAKKVLAPHFHEPEIEVKKFAIQPTVRYHTKPLNRDAVIKHVAEVVGGYHKVDLADYDLKIIVEVYQTCVGMSVVGPEYERLKRFNIAEITWQAHLNRTPTPEREKQKAVEEEKITERYARGTATRRANKAKREQEEQQQSGEQQATETEKDTEVKQESDSV